MTKLFLSLLSISLLFSSISAARQSSWQQGECQISRINAEEPSDRLQAQGGVTEYWDYYNNEFQCAGVSLHRHRIQPRGLLLPLYHNAPVLAYVVQGKGIFGILSSGCPETFESSQQSQGDERRESFSDRHQRIDHFRAGDVIAIPAGAAHWAYNNGDQELIVVAMQDNYNNANQLDSSPRSFQLAGNPQQQQHQHERGEQNHHESRNVFNGFQTEMLSEAFGINEETARSLQGQNDERGHIVTIQEGLHVISSPLTAEKQRDQPNGIEETICSAKVKENIDRTIRADIYNRNAGRLTTANGLTLPILGFLQLSAARGVLYKNAIMAPHWFVNAHNIVYITRGESRMQIVDHRGQAVFDGQVREGQAVVVPQNFAVMKQAGDRGCEWVAFNTNDNAMMNTLSGRTSAVSGLPADVIAASYRLSREEAQRLKVSRRENLFFSSAAGERAERGRVVK